MKIRELYTDESRWCQHFECIDSKGNPVDFHSNRAASWCLLGSILKCYGNDPSIISKIRSTLKEKGLGGSIFTFNDTHTFEEVKGLVELLDV